MHTSSSIKDWVRVIARKGFWEGYGDEASWVYTMKGRPQETVYKSAEWSKLCLGRLPHALYLLRQLVWIESFVGCHQNHHYHPYPQQHSGSARFEEVRTLYASGWEICVQKFGNVYQQNRETNGAFQKHLYDDQRFSELLKGCSQTMRAFLAQYSRAFRDRLPHV